MGSAVVTADQRFTLIIAGMALIFAMLSAVIGLLWRAGRNWGVITTQVMHLAESVGQIAIDTNERLQWLERDRERRRR